MPDITLNIPDTTFVSSALPSNNFSFYPLIFTGTDIGFQNCIGLLQIDLSSIPVTTVDNALLQLAVIVKSGAVPSPVVVNRVTTPFDTDTVTYTTQPSFVPTTSEIDITTSDLYSTVEIDVTTLINSWLNGTFTNNGIALTNSDGATVVQFATNNIVYEPYFPKLTITFSTTPVDPIEPYAYIYNQDVSIITVLNPIQLNNNGALLGFAHTIGTGTITVETAGTYAIWFNVKSSSQFAVALFQNNLLVPGSEYGIQINNITGMVIINAAAGDILALRLISPAEGITLGSLINASIMILRIGPPVSPALAAVNSAQNIAEMRTAIENPLLGLNLSAYDALATPDQNLALTFLLNNRPNIGYPTVSSLQTALNYAVDHVVDPNNIFVQAGAVGGSGSIANPFGTIQEGIGAVNPGGTVHILAGTYPITTQINVNKAGITLQGEPGAILLLQADVIPLVITGNGSIVTVLTITSYVPYAKEFIHVDAPNVIISVVTIYGPPQALPMSNWVDNRAVVTQAGTSNVVVDNSIFHSLRTGVYINPNTTGNISGNIVYNTKGGFVVEGGFTEFFENSWGVPANEFDIVLLAGTTMGPPYDNLPALAAANDNATILDLR